MLNFYQKVIIVFLLSLFTSGVSAATITKFSSKKEKFIKELQQFFENTSEDEAEIIMAEFRAIWPMELIAPKKEEKIYKEAYPRIS